MSGYRTIAEAGFDEIEVKKSRFLGYAVHIESLEEFQTYLAGIRKQHYDARHACSAYILGADGSIRHSSDDGEPSGTAGKPMLEVLAGTGLSDACVVVVRYFGGTLLGTGGLVRAYSDAARKALAAAKQVEKAAAIRFLVETDYTLFEKLRRRIFMTDGAVLGDTKYGERVRSEVILPEEMTEVFWENLREETAGTLLRERALSETTVLIDRPVS